MAACTVKGVKQSSSDKNDCGLRHSYTPSAWQMSSTCSEMLLRFRCAGLGQQGNYVRKCTYEAHLAQAAETLSKCPKTLPKKMATLAYLSAYPSQIFRRTAA